jgi:hypothetical protein
VLVVAVARVPVGEHLPRARQSRLGCPFHGRAAGVLRVVRGELSDRDRKTLSRPGWKLYENGIGATAAYRGEEMPPVKWHQAVRLSAADAEHARRLIVEAFGRTPERLRAAEGQMPEDH